MLVKRLAVVVISFAVGAAITFGLVVGPLETTVAEYGGLYFFLTAFFFACAIGIWLDKFLDTKFLPE